MEESCFLVVDFGTSNVRASQVTLSGKIKKIYSERVQVLRPDYNYAEIDLNILWKKTKKVIEDALKNKDGDEILSLSFSFLGDSVILVDDDLNPIGNMIVSFDRRAETETNVLKREFGEERFLEITGSKVLPELLPIKLLWLKNHAQADLDRTSRVWNLQQFIMSKLGMEDFTDFSLASRKCLLEITTGEWATDLVDYLDIGGEKLDQKITESTQIVGEIAEIGNTILDFELPVVLGAHDSECAMLGLGVDSANPSLVGNIMGTFDLLGSIRKTNQRPNQKEFADLEVTHGIEKETIIVGGSIVAGAYLEWFMKEFVHGQKDFPDFNQAINLNDIPKATFLLQNEEHGNCMIDFDLSYSIDDMYKTILEGLVFELSKIIQDLKLEQTVEVLRVGGGGSQSDAWNQLKADVYNLRVERVKNKEVSSIGAAIIAGVGLGIFESFSDGISQMVQVEKGYSPNLIRGKKYLNKYQNAERRILK